MAQTTDTAAFAPLEHEAAKLTQQETQPALGYWQDAWIRFKKDKVAMAGLCVIIFLVLIAIFGPMLLSISYADQDLAQVNQGPSAAHWFGTDNLGRDLFIRVLYGARISLSIGIVASLLNFVIGVTYGGIAGFAGGKVDRIMMNIVDVLYSVPMLLYVILLMVVLKPGLINIFIALGIAYWLPMARIVRGQILAMKEQEFVLAARTIGASKRRILQKHRSAPSSSRFRSRFRTPSSRRLSFPSSVSAFRHRWPAGACSLPKASRASRRIRSSSSSRPSPSASRCWPSTSCPTACATCSTRRCAVKRLQPVLMIGAINLWK